MKKLGPFTVGAGPENNGTIKESTKNHFGASMTETDATITISETGIWCNIKTLRMDEFVVFQV